MTTAFNSPGETISEATRTLKHDLDRSEPGSQGSGQPLVSNELALARDNIISDLERGGWSSVWSHRPQFLHLGLFIAAYVLASGFAHLLAIVPGTGISIWPPSGLFIATLILAPRHSWPWWVVAGCLAELFSNFLWFHSPLPAAFLIYVGNALEAMAGAWLVNRICGRPVRLETLQEVLAFVVVGAGVAPVISATVGSATLAWFSIESQTFAAAWPLWWIGDATGVLIVAPLTLVVLQNWRGKAELSAARWVEACVLGLIFLGVAALSLSGYLPFAYIVMPPLLWAAVRFEFKGAAVTLTLLALITAVFTISGASQFAGDPESQKQNHIMLQLFLAISAFSALIVAAISRQHQQALVTLRQSVEALRDRERELSQLVNLVPSHVWRLTPAGEPNFINKRLSDFLGLDVVDYDQPGLSRLAAAIATSAHPEDAPGIQEAIGHSLATGEPFSMRWRVRRADGVYRWVESRAEPLRDDAGVILHWYGVNVDIDDQVTAQQALRDRERELAQLVDLVPVQIRRLTPEGEPIFFNKRLLDFFGLNDVAQLDKPDMSRLAAAIRTLVHPEDAARLLETVRHSLATGEPYSMKYRMRRADGAYRWVDGRAEPVRDQSGAIVQWYAISIDIDDEMRAQEALRERERRLQQLVDAVPVNIITFTPDGKPSFANKRYQDFLGFTLPHFETLEEQLHAIIHPDDVSEMQRELLNCFKTGSTFVMRYRRRGKDGAYYWTEGRMEPLLDQNGAIEHWYAVSLDIDDEMRAQEALRERERFLWQLVETLPAMIDCAAPDGEPVYRSQQLREFLGYELEELDGTGKSRLAGTLDAGVHPDDVAGVKENYAHSLATGEPYARRHRLRRFDGEYRWVETRAAPMRNAEGAIVQWNVICLEIESEIRAQEELRLAREGLARASQAASLAELSASIAHEVNQPLAAIVANSHACHRWLSAEPPNVERAKVTADRIIRDANSAADVVSRIRALFRQSVEPRNDTALSSVIAEARNLIAEEAARRRIRMDVDVDSDLPLVALDRIQIQQVLVNLIRNGMDAMDSVAGERVLAVRVRRMGDVVQTEISDHGLGVEFPERIFEPFFTTKEHGMGMGLAICRSIVESHGGRLWAEKNESHGATFIFTLPVEVKAAA